MSIEFPAERWDVSAGDEVMAEHFEDIRKAIWRRWSIMNRDLDFDDLPPWVNPYYAEPGDIRTRNGIAWIATGEGILGEPGVDGGWSEYALSYRYSHFCDNSSKVRHRLVEGNVSRFPLSTGYLPLQVTRVNNPKAGSAWAASTSYSKGDIVRLYDAQNIVFSFRCKADHTSSAANRPYEAGWNWGLHGFDDASYPLRDTYWRCVGEPWTVANEGGRIAGETDWFISRNIGACYATDRTMGIYPYHINDGVPAEWDPLDSAYNDEKYWEYQSGVERVCEEFGPWFDTGVADYDDDPVPPVAAGDDYRWDCNQSAFELILKLIDSYDWYFDPQFYPDDGSDPPKCPICGEYAHPVWRRTWRHSMRLSPYASLHLRDKDAASRPLSSCSDYQSTNWTYNGTPYANWTAICQAGLQQQFLEEQNWQDATPADPYHIDNAAMDAVRLRHTYSHWHGNPPAQIMMDMRDVLLWIKYYPIRVVVYYSGRAGYGNEPWPTGGNYGAANQAGYDNAQGEMEADGWGAWYVEQENLHQIIKSTMATRHAMGYPTENYYGGNIFTGEPPYVSQISIGVKAYVSGATNNPLPAIISSNITGVYLPVTCYGMTDDTWRSSPEGPPPETGLGATYWEAFKQSACSLTSSDGSFNLSFPLYVSGEEQPIEIKYVWLPVSIEGDYHYCDLYFADHETPCPLPEPPSGGDQWVIDNCGGAIVLTGEQRAKLRLPSVITTTGAEIDFDNVPLYE